MFLFVASLWLCCKSLVTCSNHQSVIKYFTRSAGDERIDCFHLIGTYCLPDCCIIVFFNSLVSSTVELNTQYRATHVFIFKGFLIFFLTINATSRVFFFLSESCSFKQHNKKSENVQSRMWTSGISVWQMVQTVSKILRELHCADQGLWLLLKKHVVHHVSKQNLFYISSVKMQND